MFRKITFIVGWFLLFLCAGCHGTSPLDEEPSTSRMIQLNLDINATRAPDGSVPGNFHLWIFSQDKLLKYISNNPQWTDVHNGSIDLTATVETEINSSGVLNLNFYLLLNASGITSPQEMTVVDIKQMTFSLADYEGDYDVPMSGYKENVTITSDQNDYKISIDALRAVGKLEMYFTRGEESSTLAIDQISLNQIPSSGYYFKDNGQDFTPGTGTKIIFTAPENGVNVDTFLPVSVDVPQFEENIEHFTQVIPSMPFLLENEKGGEGLQVDNVVNQIDDEATRYYLTLTYTTNNTQYDQKVYLSSIERNTIYKLFLRVTNKQIACEVVPWKEISNDVPAFE